MDTETYSIKALIDLLKENGYPDEAIVVEWPIGGRYRVDLAVIDPDTQQPLILFESKRHFDNQTLKTAQTQLENYARALKAEHIPQFIVFPAVGYRPFTLFKIEEGKPARVNDSISLSEIFPNYGPLKNTAKQGKIKETEEDTEKAQKWIQFMSWGLFIIVAVLLFLDSVNILEITPERLGLLTLLIATVLLPFASKFKILGVEFERLRGKHKD